MKGRLGRAGTAPVEAEAAARAEILGLVRRYQQMFHQGVPFVPGESKVPYSGRVYDETEMVNLVDSALDFWLTAGPYGDAFEKRMRQMFKARAFMLVASGSSANLVMMAALTSPQAPKPLRPGDEMITPAVTFPTTLTPIVQYGLVPVFVDCELGTYNVDLVRLAEAVTPRTRGIFIPHTLGNPCDMEVVMRLAQAHDLIVLEDCCDALGSLFDGRLVGTFGNMASLSFYPAHHITTGEGGGLIVNESGLVRVARSARDWGRDCWCPPGVSNTCAKRFDWKLGDLPPGYDHKYVFTSMGYNLKATEMQAAIGLAQHDKIPTFVERRRENFTVLYQGLKKLEEHLVLPRWHPLAIPSWFAFPITVREHVRRADLIAWLENAKIETRLLFCGNAVRQPAFSGMQHRIVGDLAMSDVVMERTFFLGVYPGLTRPMLDYMIETLHDYFRRV
ncbi:MAG: lipopolysaccharide biosynthesis protein RfbH [Chloroflexi bacterium]|nr:lipopolysaccharide biosynthesis protein RfbH [Chloroflexota bacterium]